MLRRRKAVGAEEAASDMRVGAGRGLQRAVAGAVRSVEVKAAATKPEPAGKRKKEKPPPEDIGIARLVLGSPLAHPLAGAVPGGALDQATLRLACEHLAQADPLLQPLIEEHGPPERLLTKSGECFASLSKSIIFQQLATRAASVIYDRVLEACQCTDFLTPEELLAAPVEALRACGLSERKVSYLVDLSAHFSDGRLTDEAIAGLGDAELHERLVAVKGIGPWTVNMFCMFHLGRPNVLPVGDLGVRKGMQVLYGLRDLPTPSAMEGIAQRWEPYRSVGSYFMWRVEAPRATKAKKAKA